MFYEEENSLNTFLDLNDTQTFQWTMDCQLINQPKYQNSVVSHNYGGALQLFQRSHRSYMQQ